LIRGGLQALGRGQTEAATALGLGYWRTLALIRLPQAIALALPPIVSLFIGFFKNTSLVMTIGIFDLTERSQKCRGRTRVAGFGTEAYLFAGAIYFVFCFAMSRYGLSLERRLARPRDFGPGGSRLYAVLRWPRAVPSASSRP
ncbi:ABC transporter type 1, transmembrane domain MetI-like protein, partial [Tribonema minus]